MAKKNREKNYQWNFIVNLLDGTAFWFGNSFISTTTIIPLYISKLSDSLFPIGLVAVITSAGWFLPQLFAAKLTEGAKKMKPIVIGWGLFLERLPIWLMLVSALIAGCSPQWGLALFLVSLAWHTLGAGLVAPSWQALLGRIFVPEKRGSFMGLTMFVGVGIGALGSALGAWILEVWHFPRSFVVLFLIAAVFITLSWVFLALTREPDLPVSAEDRNWRRFGKDLLGILKGDENFRRFVITNMIITFGSMGFGYVTISAISRFQVSDATVGLYTLVMLISQTVGNLVLGWMADRFGHKLSVEIGILAASLAFLISLLMPSPFWYYFVYALLGIYLSSGIVSGMLLVMEFSDIPRIPSYAGLANTTRGLIGLIAPMIGAHLAKTGYGLLFALCTGLTFLGLVLMRYWIKEPRWKPKGIQHEKN
jgi:MFS family permease